MATRSQSALHAETARPPSPWVWTAFLVLCVIAAAAAIRRIAVLIAPPAVPRAPQLASLDLAFASRTPLTLAHIVPALIFVALLPPWFSRRVRNHEAMHRRITYALFLMGAIVGITAIPLSMRPIGGLNETSAVLLYDGLFLFSLARAWVLLRRGDLLLHRTWMLRAVAVLLGIAMTRPIMGIFFATASITHLQPQQFFGTAFWIGFTTSYIAGESYIRWRHRSG